MIGNNYLKQLPFGVRARNLATAHLSQSCFYKLFKLFPILKRMGKKNQMHPVESCGLDVRRIFDRISSVIRAGIA